MKQYTLSKTPMDDFYKDFNSEGCNNTKFNLWKLQRNTIIDVISRIETENGTLNNIAILGAGNCNDIDLEYLSNKYQSISLFDIDKCAMEKGIQKYNINKNCQMDIIDAEFTGLKSINFYNEFAKRVQSGESIKKLSSFIRKTVMKMERLEQIEKYNNKYDFVMSMPVYTQLSYPLCACIFSENLNKYSQDDVKFMMEEFNYLAIAASKKFNNFIYDIGTPDAKYFIMTDVMEFTNETRFIENLVRSYIEKGNHQEITNLFSKYHRLSGALEGIQDIWSRTEFQALNYWLWPFSDEKSYLVYGVRTKKKA